MDTRMKYFIEIGCNDYDTLMDLCCDGWAGVMIEPVKSVFDRLPRVTNCFYENIAIAEKTGTANFYVVPDNTDWSSLVEGHNTKINPESKSECVVVETMSFDDLMEKYPFPQIDFLKIDTEGYDGKIILSIDFSRYDIRRIQYEHFHLSDDEDEKVQTALENAGFKMIQCDDMNFTWEK